MLQILSIFMEIKSGASIIFVPNLKEIKIWEDSFHKFQIYFYFCAKKKKNTKKIGWFSRANISWTAGAISIKFSMQGKV